MKKIQNNNLVVTLMLLIFIEWIISIILVLGCKLLYTKGLNLYEFSIVSSELFLFLITKLAIILLLYKLSINNYDNISVLNIAATALMLLILISLKSRDIFDLRGFIYMFSLSQAPTKGGGFYIIGRGYFLLLSALISYFVYKLCIKRFIKI